MCVWFQSAVHVYRSELSLAENVFGQQAVWRWTNPEAAERFRSSCDDVCLDGYMCAGSGILMNIGLPGALLGLLVLLLAPILFGIGAAMSRRFALAVFAVWSLVIFWGMLASFARYSEYAPAADIRQVLLQTPVQYTFDIVAMLLLPALPFFLTARLLTVARRWLERRRIAR